MCFCSLHCQTVNGRIPSGEDPQRLIWSYLPGARHFAYTMHGHFYFGNIPVYVILCLFSDAAVNAQTVTIKRLPWSGRLQIKLSKDYSI